MTYICCLLTLQLILLSERCSPERSCIVKLKAKTILIRPTGILTNNRSNSGQIATGSRVLNAYTEDVFPKS